MAMAKRSRALAQAVGLARATNRSRASRTMAPTNQRIARRPMTAMLACATSPLVIQRASRSSTLVLVLVTAAAMVALRALPYLLYEQLAFDSDQAIVGLMAKHLVEGRAFPLFFYGQTYMLAVESWAAAPFFLIAGPTV